MNKEENVINTETALLKTEPVATELEVKEFPALVEAEKMFDRLSDLTRETAHKAYEYFVRRGGDLGREIDDWFQAESDILLPVKVEITETDKLINVVAMVPGFKPEEIEISVDGKILILSGETKSEKRNEDETTIYSEWRSNRFLRRLTLPGDVDANKVKAHLTDGVLRLKLPKAEPREVVQVAVATG